MAEGVVNLAKILEVLFLPSGNNKPMDAARRQLQRLGYSTEQVERYFVPAIVLRNSVDSAHVDLTLFTMSQLRSLQAYTEAAEPQFRGLLQKILTKMAAGRFELAPTTPTGPHTKTAKIIERLAKNFAADAR